MPSVGERGEHHPAVDGRRLALDDAGPHEAVEAAGEPARGELQPRGEVAHAHRVVVGLGQVHEHLVVAERQAVRARSASRRGVRSTTVSAYARHAAISSSSSQRVRCAVAMVTSVIPMRPAIVAMVRITVI